MANKNTKNMLIRDVPEVLWSEIDHFCEQNKMVRRQFIEMAFKAIQQSSPQQHQCAELWKIEQNFDEVERKLNVYDRFYRIHKEINRIKELYKEENAPIRKKLNDELEGLRELLGGLLESSFDETFVAVSYPGLVVSKPKAEHSQGQQSDRSIEVR